MLRELRGQVRAVSGRVFTNREVYMRAHGEVRFLKISARFQKAAATSVAGAAALWLGLSGNVIWSQWTLSEEREALGAAAREIAYRAKSVEERRRLAIERADAVEARQVLLEGLAEQYFKVAGAEEPKKAAAAKPDETASAELRPLQKIADVDRRQGSLVERLEQVASARAGRAEAAVRKLGLSVDRLARSGGQGGPFIPASGSDADEDIAQLGETLARLDRLERALLTVPSFMPAEGGSMSSPFGLRRDPFNRRAAMHKGQDFRGRHNSDIRAAAPGRVVRAGWWSGYGRAIVVDHGAGIRTRYAHLTKIDVKRGDTVSRGQRIGGMGSTGRSTGTHLHFEVRIDGKAVNPRPFLETAPHVLEIQNLAGRRIAGATDAN